MLHQREHNFAALDRRRIPRQRGEFGRGNLGALQGRQSLIFAYLAGVNRRRLARAGIDRVALAIRFVF